jgi:hypothetical protein
MSEDYDGVENGSESEPESPVHDGLSSAQPIPRDETGPAEPTDEEASGTVPGGSGGEAGMANSAGGIMDKDTVDAQGSSSGTAETEAAGLNAAAGPAADQESGTPDDRGLTTDITPSD